MSLEEISRLHQLSPLPGSDKWYIYPRSTPSHKFLNAIKWFEIEKLACEFTIRDSYAEDLLIKLVRFTDMQSVRLSCKRQIEKVENFQQGTGLTAVIYTNYDCHTAFKYENPSLHLKTLVAFPAFKCEFSGDETPDQFICMRRDFVTTVDWSRKPAPKILMRYANSRTKSKSTGNKLGLANISSLVLEIQNLEDSRESFIEIENFLHQRCKITSNGTTNHVSYGDLELSPIDTTNFVTRFVYEGMIETTTKK